MGQGAFQWTEKFDPFWQEVFWCAIAFLGVLVIGGPMAYLKHKLALEQARKKD
eukprot:CAMPEP_0117048288 /NCGR_PEP_ID=MMETSP0472-20121206/33376_1 /TAXON_ID=693140 ORGANISM="Tiarina fusus, Strain LIS" /NCGR_SAMPLE_ID=MMETSP0472 /ASSEMBLY_ACC=CAM_ASM_000603 /LENGTH=52 /DNA_ID=CAMNT_0004761323 /DNA_START=94 /DNA_END=252 /DNA_ORIENTATION=-